MIRPVAALVFIVGLSGCNVDTKEPKDPQQVEFDKKFDEEAVLVKTCPGDPRWASGPTAAGQRVYRFEKELWALDVSRGMTRYRKLEATPETVCDVLVGPRPPDPPNPPDLAGPGWWLTFSNLLRRIFR
jgi:hypothetical protein